MPDCNECTTMHNQNKLLPCVTFAELMHHARHIGNPLTLDSQWFIISAFKTINIFTPQTSAYYGLQCLCFYKNDQGMHLCHLQIHCVTK
jgi:hypothetical protein